MKMIKKTFASIMVILLVIGMMAGSVLPASAAVTAGDVNTDGKVDLLDVMVTLRLMAGLEYKGSHNVRAMFVSGDSVANTADAVLILRTAAGWTDTVLTAPASTIKDAAFKAPSATCASYYYGAEVNVFDQNIRHSSDVYYEGNDEVNGAPNYTYTKASRIQRFHTIMDNYDPDVVGLQEYRSDEWYNAWEGTTGHTNRTSISTNGGALAYTVNTSSDSILGSGYSGYIQSRADPTKTVTWAKGVFAEYKSKVNAGTAVNAFDYAYQPDERLAIFWKTDKYTMMDKGVFWINNAGANGVSVPFYPSPYDSSYSGEAWDNFEYSGTDANGDKKITLDEASYVLNNYNRLCIWVKLKDKDTGIVFYYATTHLHTSADGHSIPAAQVVMDEMDLVMDAKGEAPLIISGDFNLPDTCTAYTNLAAKYNDVAAEMGCAEKTFSAYTYKWLGSTKPALSKRIDFVFTEDRGGTADTLTCKVVKDTATGTYTDANSVVHTYENDVPSDHRGLNCDILINN